MATNIPKNHTRNNDIPPPHLSHAIPAPKGAFSRPQPPDEGPIPLTLFANSYKSTKTRGRRAHFNDIVQACSLSSFPLLHTQIFSSPISQDLLHEIEDIGRAFIPPSWLDLPESATLKIIRRRMKTLRTD